VTYGPQEFDITEEYQAQIDAARIEVGKAVDRYTQLLRGPAFPEDPPFVQGWAVGVEWTNIWMEKENKGGREIITPQGQMLSLTEGLGAYVART